MTTEHSHHCACHGPDLSGIVGRHLIYRYANGWRYELYIKNAMTIDYRIHDGLVAGLWVKDQHVHLAHLGEQRFTVWWTESSGSGVNLVIDLGTRQLHGAIVVADEFARIHFLEDCGPDNDRVISAPPSALPAGYLDRQN